MAIKVARRIQRTPIAEETKKESPKKQNDGTLPSDTYKDEIPPKEIELDENGKLVVSVVRGGELGLPNVDIRHYVTTERYTGFTKKGINFPLELLMDMIETLKEVLDECADKGLE